MRIQSLFVGGCRNEPGYRLNSLSFLADKRILAIRDMPERRRLSVFSVQMMPDHYYKLIKRSFPVEGINNACAYVLFVLLILLVVNITVSGSQLLTPQQLKALQNHYGQAAVKRIEDWQAMIVANRDESERQKLEIVNQYFNRMEFISDMEHWGKKDYWATPVEFIATAAGDCEDFSIAKYFTLRELGIETEKLRLIYVKATSINQAHMVLGYYKNADAEPLILDNLDPEIQPASLRQDLIPSYSFNGNSLWQAKMLREGGIKVGKSANIGIWKMLMERMEIKH